MTLEDADNAITHWVLCGCYGVLLLVFLYGLLRLLASRWRSRLRFILNIMFYGLVIVGAITRIAYFALIVAVREDWVDVDHVLLYALIDVPTLFFLTSYSIILFYWAELYHSKRKSKVFTEERLLIICLLVNALAYMIVATLLWIDLFIYSDDAEDENSSIDGAEPLNWAEININAIITAFYVTFSIAYLVYGWKAVSLFKQVPAVTPERRAVLRRLTVMVVVVPICFILRAPVAVIGSFWSFSGHWDWFDLPYYSLLEIVPLLVMMYVLMYKPQSTMS